MTRIIAAINDSAAATPVLQTALALTPLLGSAVEALHVADEAGITASACAEQLGVALRTVSGDPLEQILLAIAADDVVAVVVGAHGRPSQRPPAGHIPLSLVSATVKPVVIVPPAQPASPIRRVLIAIEGSPRKARSLKRAVELAGAAQLELTVVHVDEEDSIPMFSDQPQHETEVYTGEFLARCCPGAPQAALQLRTGEPAEEILAAANDVDPDLIAIGWPHGGDPARGHVARAIVDRCRRPVLLVAYTDAAA